MEDSVGEKYLTPNVMKLATNVPLNRMLPAVALCQLKHQALSITGCSSRTTFLGQTTRPGLLLFGPRTKDGEAEST